MRQTDNDNFIRIFQNALLVWLRKGVLNTALAEPPFALPASARVTSASGTVLKIKRGRRTTGNLTEWPQLGLHGKPNPFLAFVLDGPVDLSVGVTERMVQGSDACKVRGVYQLRFPSQSVLIYPAHVPTSDGVKPHWAGEAREPVPDSTILWVDIMPEGAILHTCRTKAGSHTLGSQAFVFNTHLFQLTESLIEELRATSSSDVPNELAQTLLQVLLLRIVRSLSQRQYKVNADILEQITKGVGEQSNSSGRSSSVKRACNFIEAHLSRHITVEKIAQQAFVSPAQLNRLFRVELGRSVMQYVNEQRLEKAKSLLINTTLPVNIISENLGVGNVVYFCRMFREKTGMTPLQYRRQQR